MKKFIVALLSNRFGIILAALNVCYLAGRGEVLIHISTGNFFAAANSPALISTLVSLEFLTFLTGGRSPFTEWTMGNAFFVFYIVGQWLLIGWFACTLAGKLRHTSWWKNHAIRW